MKTTVQLLSAISAFASSAALAEGNDFLAKQKIPVAGPQSDVVLQRTIADARAIFQNYEPTLDSSYSLTSPVKVSGSSASPSIHMSLQKCVVIACQNVDVVGDVTIRPARGSCTENFLLRMDLSRSGDTLSSVYDSLDVGICLNRNPDGSGQLLLDASAQHAPTYARGLMQNEIVAFLRAQVSPITRAIQKVLQAKAAK